MRLTIREWFALPTTDRRTELDDHRRYRHLAVIRGIWCPVVLVRAYPVHSGLWYSQRTLAVS